MEAFKRIVSGQFPGILSGASGSRLHLFRVLNRRRRSPAPLVFTLATLAMPALAATPVIVISIDTLRADHLSAYGYRAVRTPNIDSFADHGILYQHASAQVPLTLPSHTSLFTSTYPFQTGVRENAQVVPSGLTTLPEVLRAHGYKTGAFIGSVFLEKEMGLDKGFDFYDSPFQFTAFSALSGSVFYGGIGTGPNVGKDRREAPLVTRAALQWLRQNKGKPTFAFVHLYDLHKPNRLGSYDSELVYVDQILGAFRKSLEALGLWDRSIIVLLSDHGESLGDHGEESHGYYIYESTVHVPLLFHLPESIRTEVVETPASLLDVAPSLLDYLHIPAPPSFVGRALQSSAERWIYAETFHAHDSFGWAALRSLQKGFWKFIEAPRPELYNLQTDPGERHNVYLTQRKIADELSASLKTLPGKFPAAPTDRKPDGNTSTPSQSANQRLLNSLGYLSGAPASKAKNLSANGPDPKDRLPEFRLYEDAIFALSRGGRNQAIALLKKLLAKDSVNTLARRDLGACYLDAGDYTNARVHLERAAESAPDDYAIQYELGVTYKNLQLNDLAFAHLNIACHLAPAAQQCQAQLQEVRKKR